MLCKLFKCNLIVNYQSQKNYIHVSVRPHNKHNNIKTTQIAFLLSQTVPCRGQGNSQPGHKSKQPMALWFGIILLALLFAYATRWYWKQPKQIEPKAKAVLVTGAASGFGKESTDAASPPLLIVPFVTHFPPLDSNQAACRARHLCVCSGHKREAPVGAIWKQSKCYAPPCRRHKYLFSRTDGAASERLWERPIWVSQTTFLSHSVLS